MLTTTEEDYLKAIYKHTVLKVAVSTNALAAELKTAPASVTDMVKRLSEKQFIHYTPYKGVSLTEAGLETALQIVRQQRLWEVFLVNKLKFTWDEVHEVAEQLEHVRSRRLIDKLDEFLGFPRFDPHGDPIPDAQGHIAPLETVLLAEVPLSTQVRIARVTEHSPDFLQYLDRLSLSIDTRLHVIEKIDFDDSLIIRAEYKEVIVSRLVASRLLVVLEG
jgi:DtxR family transcriptional regulator, Mn-dependent transcriptional regulator